MPVRYYSLDNLRMAMMMLGLVLHAAGPYMVAVYLPDDTKANNPFFDILFLFIHTFRMPAFFVMAGFFSALLVDRRGINAFMRNRANRILIPFVVGYFTVNILIQAAYVYAFSNYDLAPVQNWFATGAFLLPVITPTVHLWFLYFLLIYYVGVYVVMRFNGRATTLPGYRLSQWLVSAWAIPAWIVLSAVFLWFMPGATFYTPSNLTPSPIIIAGLGLYYAFGWLLFQQSKWLEKLRQPTWWLLLGGGILFAVYADLMWKITNDTSIQTTYRIDLSLLAAASVWLITFGLIGLFQRYFNQHNYVARYLSDASYWIYIIHLLICTYIQIWLMPVAWSAFAKYGVGFVLTLLLSLISYDLFVRDTRIGQVLNGRRATPLWRTLFGRKATESESLAQAD